MGAFTKSFTNLGWCTALLLGVAATGCSGGRDPILGGGSGAALAPSVTAVAPVEAAESVPINLAVVSAVFSEPMKPITDGATFTLTCRTPCSNPTGTVTLDVSESIAEFNLASSTTLESRTLYTATLSGARSLATGLALARPYTWTFTTGDDPDNAAPRVSSTSPADGATATAINTLITASFSEPMNALSVGATSFTLSCAAGTSVLGVVDYSPNGSVVIFTPDGNLPSSTTCQAALSATVEDMAGNAMGEPFVWSFTTGMAADTSPPTVNSTNPLAGDSGVAINSLITASFSEPMDPLTITAANFTLTCSGGTPVIGSVGYAANGHVATFTPADDLAAGVNCTARIATGVTDLAHNAIANVLQWSFMTGVAADVIAPTVSASSPVANVGGVALNTSVTASFSESMNPLTLSTATFTLACPAGTPVTGTVGYAVSGNVATFVPTNNLPASTSCRATIDADVTDVAHNPMVAAYTWLFTTGTASDTTAPTVSSTNPLTGDSGVAINSSISASFSEPMDPQTISAANLTLACPSGTPISGSVGYAVNGNVGTFTPSNDLPPGTSCTAQIGTGAQDASSNSLATAFSWSFTTGVAPDVTAPLVSSTSPAADTTGIAINTLVTASFSEPMNPLTLTSATFTLACPGTTPITGTVGYAASGNVATFTPTAVLPASTSCTAQIDTGAQDAANNSIATAFSWGFTTGAAPDATAPTVSSTSPAANATGVSINMLITASFSEPMDPLTLTSAVFTLACPGDTPVSGTVAYAVSGSVATFTPTAGLPASTGCIAQIGTGAQDAAGNSIASAFIWSFTTGVAPDVTPPTVTSTNPLTGAVGVCTNKTLNATFSEPMDPLTISTATLELAVTEGEAVTGVVTFDAMTNIATFDPAEDLIGSPATDYTATLRGGPSGVKDLAGNPLAADVVVTFTTNSSTCTTAPPLGAAAPFGGFGGLATLTNDGLATVINGDIGVNAASTTITGLHDAGGNVYTITPDNNGSVNGLIYTTTAPPGSPAGIGVTQARAAALATFNSISPANLPGGIDVSSLAQCPSCGGAGGGADELADRTLPPGIYLSATGTYDIGGAGRTTANLTLDAGGDANAVWVFQTTPGTGTLSVGLTGPATPAVPIKVLLVNGAQPRNVFWFVPAGATIGTGSTVVGTILANAAITISTTGGSPPSAVVTTIEGRAISLTAAVTMTNTVINVPAP